MRPDFLKRYMAEIAASRLSETQVRAFTENWTIAALAEHFGESYEDTQAQFDLLRPALHALVNSPEGWAALSVLLSSGDAPRPTPLLVATIH